VQEAVYGAVRFRGRLDYLLGLHVTRGLDRMDPALLPVLRLGAYQLLYMGGCPRTRRFPRRSSRPGNSGGEVWPDS
jgi:hypothetical protein